MKINGVVEAVGEKFNGSLKVNGAWHNLKKGVKQTAKVGDNVELELGTWEFKGKEGTNVVAIKINGPAEAPAKPQTKKEEASKAEPRQVSPPSGARDFDKEARGKTRCALLEAMLSNHSCDTSDLEKIFEIVDKGVAYVFGDK